jgi:hypothetical protein
LLDDMAVAVKSVGVEGDQRRARRGIPLCSTSQRCMRPQYAPGIGHATIRYFVSALRRFRSAAGSAFNHPRSWLLESRELTAILSLKKTQSKPPRVRKTQAVFQSLIAILEGCDRCREAVQELEVEGRRAARGEPALRVRALYAGSNTG